MPDTPSTSPTVRPTRLIIAAALLSVVLTAAFGLIDERRLALLTGGELPDYPAAGGVDLVGLDGEPWPLDTLRGDIVILEFWATWCGPCIIEIDDYNELTADYQANGVKLIAVAMQSGSAEEIAAFAERHGITYQVAVGNNAVWEAFGPMWGFPTTLLFDRDGRLRRAWEGAGGGKMRQLRAAVDELLAKEGSTR